MKAELFTNYKSYYKWRGINKDAEVLNIRVEEGLIIVHYKGEADFFTELRGEAHE